MLVLSRKNFESIHIGSDIVIHVTQIGPRSVRLAIDAPRHVRILRGELPAEPPQLTTLEQPEDHR